MIRIKSIAWRNFKAYGDYWTTIDFDAIEGATLIEGEHDGNEDRRCAAGKTTIVEALVWGVFGSTTETIKPGDSVVHWFTQRDCCVKIVTYDDWEIIRTRGLKGKDELIITHGGEDKTKSTSMPAQAFINQTFKIDYKTFAASVVFGQFADGFLEVSDKKRRTILERLMKVGNLNGIAATAKSKADAVKLQVEFADKKLEELLHTLSEADQASHRLGDKVEIFNSNQKERCATLNSSVADKMAALQRRVDGLRASAVASEAKLAAMTIVDVVALGAEWTKFQTINAKITAKEAELGMMASDIKVAKAKLSSKLDVLSGMVETAKATVLPDVKALEAQWKSYNEANAEIKIMTSNAHKLGGEAASTEQEIATNLKKRDNLGKLGGSCPTCETDITDDHKCSATAKYDSIIKDLQDSLKVKKQAVIELSGKIKHLAQITEPVMKADAATALHTKHQLALGTIKKLSEEVSADQTAIAALTVTATNNSALLQKIKELRDKQQPKTTLAEAQSNNQLVAEVKKTIAGVDEAINAAKASLADELKAIAAEVARIKAEDNPYLNMIRDAKVRRDTIVAERVALETERDQKRALNKHLAYIADSYSNKKKIKAFWIGRLIPYLNKRIKYYMDLFELKDEIKFDEFLTPHLSRWSYTDHSGGERKCMDLSIMFALGDLHTSIFGQQSNILVLDEVDGRLDKFWIDKLVSVIQDDFMNRKDGLTNILVISHKEEMKDRFPHKIRVKNKSENAFIVNE